MGFAVGFNVGSVVGPIGVIVGLPVGLPDGLIVGSLVSLSVGRFDGRFVGFRIGFILIVGIDVGAAVGGGVGIGGSVKVTVPDIVFEMQSIFVILIRSVASKDIMDEIRFRRTDSRYRLISDVVQFSTGIELSHIEQTEFTGTASCIRDCCATELNDNVNETCISFPSGRNVFSNRIFPLLESVGLPFISLIAAVTV